MEKNNCVLYEDLLSLYVDDLTQPESKRLMQEHLTRCASCRAKYEEMTKPLSVTAHKVDEPTIDHLKSIRRRQRTKLLLIVFGLFSALVFALLIKTFVLGTPTAPDILQYEKIGDSLHIQAQYTGSAQVLTRHALKDRGDHYELILYSGLPSVLHGEAALELTVPLDKAVHVHGDVIQKDGFVIKAFTQALYDTKHQYLGDASKNINLLNVLGVYRIAPFTIELKTKQTPYELIVHSEFPGTPNQRIQDNMVDYAIIILSLIDNCDIVSWQVDASSAEPLKVDLLDATAVLGASPKAFGKDVVSFQKLLNELGL